jgi:NitT/TauT family transport system ATP-binding protein/sulfonate transport system ATP-binding protein
MAAPAEARIEAGAAAPAAALPSPEAPVLSAEGLWAWYGNGSPDRPVLEDLSLEVRDNEFLVVLGPGQCGKTTLLNCLAGLMSPGRGVVRFRGRPVDGPGRERGVVFQRYALFPWQTVLQNVAWGLKAQGMARRGREEIARRFIDLVGLTGFEGAYPQALSGGMRQRVGLARAYAAGPEVLLMDEPFGALDAQTRYAMEKELLSIWSKERRSVVLVTNNIEEAVFLGDRVVLMSAFPGRITSERAVGLPHPRNYTDPEFLFLRKTISDETDLVL